jgi:predicted amidohydrolase YtcJ
MCGVVATSVFGCPKSAPKAPPTSPTDQPTSPPFTTLIVGAKILGGPSSDALGVVDTKIAAIGLGTDLRKRCSSRCTVIDAAGGFLSPGFHDAHAHPYTAGQAAAELAVHGALGPIQQAVRQWAEKHSTGWISGRGWAAAFFPTLPTRADLDAVESVRPVTLVDGAGHTLWTNSAALRAAKITAKTPDPPGGKFLRDASGEPTGIFFDAAMALVLAAKPPLSDEELRAALLRGQEFSLAMGITSTQGGPVSLRQAQAYAKLDAEGALKERMFLWAPLVLTDENFQRWIEASGALPAGGRVHVVAFKGFLDGIFGVHTAATIEPYADTGKRAPVEMDLETLKGLVVRANRAGFPVALHAIGDQAVRVALDAFAHSKSTLHHSLVNRVEHANLVASADIPRFREIGVAASMHPGFMEAGTLAGVYPGKVLGPVVAERLYPYGELHRAGATVVFGSDYPAGGPLDPVMIMFLAVRRELRDGSVLGLAERVDGEFALDAYTRMPAELIGFGDRLGHVRVGDEADLVVLGGDPREARARSLDALGLRMVMIAGEVIDRPRP